MSVLGQYSRAQDEFDAVVAAVPPRAWDAPSACSAWTVRDVTGHVIWAQRQLRHWATGTSYPGPSGGPGSAHPAELAAADPVGTWRSARAETAAALTGDALVRSVTLPGLGEQPLSAIVALLVTDHLAHAWDIAHAVGSPLRLPADLVAYSLAWAHDHAVRAPGTFGPELSPPPDADEQTRWLAYLGRAPWAPVAARPGG